MNPQEQARRREVPGQAATHPQRPFPPSEPLIDARIAGRMLGVPHTWVLAQAREGKIPHHRLGHYVRFRRSDLERWLVQTRLGTKGKFPG